MSSFHGKYPIIHDIANFSGTSFSAYTYLEVVSGRANASAVINGVTVNLAAGQSIEVVVNSISSPSGDLYLLGMPKNVLVGSSVLGGTGG